MLALISSPITFSFVLHHRNNPDSLRGAWPNPACWRTPGAASAACTHWSPVCRRDESRPCEQQRGEAQNCSLPHCWLWRQLWRDVSRRQPRTELSVLLLGSVTSRLDKFLRTILGPLWKWETQYKLPIKLFLGAGKCSDIYKWNLLHRCSTNIRADE